MFNLVDWDLPAPKFNRTTIICYFLIGFQFITLAMVAYVYAPNNWDSMTYHLSRVMHWQQNQSVAIYATNILRQVQSPPFAEYSIANLQMLVGNDRYDNFVQYLAFFACFICVTNITKKLRGSPDQQILAGMISISIPTAILQATGTQNDLVVSLWLACFISMGVSLINEPENSLWVIGMGLSLGLACLTQAIAYILALPFCIWFGVILIQRNPKNITKGLMIAGLILLINSGFVIRNMLIFSNPLGTGINFQMASQIHSLAELASNVIRNLALNFTDNQNIISKGILSYLQLIHKFTGFSDADLRISLYSRDIVIYSHPSRRE